MCKRHCKQYLFSYLISQSLYIAAILVDSSFQKPQNTQRLIHYQILLFQCLFFIPTAWFCFMSILTLHVSVLLLYFCKSVNTMLRYTLQLIIIGCTTQVIIYDPFLGGEIFSCADPEIFGNFIMWISLIWNFRGCLDQPPLTPPLDSRMIFDLHYCSIHLK